MTTELTKGIMAKRRLPRILHSLSGWVGPSRAQSDPEDPSEAQTEESPKLVERPVEKAVLWLPGGWGEQETSRPYPYELFVEQEVLRDVEDHAQEEIDGSYGLLTGRLLACKKTKIPFVSVEATHRSDSPMPDGDDLTSFRGFFWEVREAVERRGRIVVGWYHTHSLLGLQLSERDRQLHVAHFHDEWPCALVVVMRRGTSEGGFFQRDRGDILFRRSTRPFRELVKQRVKPGGGPYVSSVVWENYWTHEPVLYARKPGDLPSKGGKLSWRQQPRIGPRSDNKMAALAARFSEESEVHDADADASDVDSHRPTPANAPEAERRESGEPTYERAMGRPVHEEVVVSGRPAPGAPLPEDAWDQWKKASGTRRELEDEVPKVEAERAAADADLTARSKAALAARAAAAAAARAVAEALGIRSEGDAIADEAMAEADAEVLVVEAQAAKLAAKKATEKEAAKKPETEEPEEAAPASVAEAVDEEEPEPVAEAELAPEAEPEVEALADEMDEGAAVAEEEPEPVADVEPAPEAEVEALADGIEERAFVAEEEPEPVSKAEPAPEAEPRPEAEIEETVVLEVAASKSESVAVPPEEPRVGETSKELAEQEGVPAKPPVRFADKAEMVPVPFVLADSPPRARLRRYTVWVGIGLSLAAALAWLVFG